MLPAEEEGIVANQQFRNLVTLYIRITLLSDVFATVGQPQSRATIGLWQTLMSSIPRQVLANLGALHRSSAWESSIFAAGLKGKGIELPEYAIFGLGEGTPSLVPAIPAGAAVSSSVTAVNEGSVTPAVTPTLTGQGSTAKQGGPQDWNAAALVRIIRGLPNTLAPFFQGMIPSHITK
jgi:E3 ubiquitin-protein ligase HUWE1